MTTPLYFVECEWTAPFGCNYRYYPERDLSSMARGSTICDIKSGQLENVRHVIEVELDGSAARDVTEDIALEVLSMFDDEPRGQVREFLEAHCPDALAEYCDDLNSARPDRQEHSTRFAAYSGAV